MAGWLGSNFTAQLDQIKKGVNQVSSIVKDTLVVDESWDQDDGDMDQQMLEEELTDGERKLLGRYQRLEKLYNVSQEIYFRQKCPVYHRWSQQEVSSLHVFLSKLI